MICLAGAVGCNGQKETVKTEKPERKNYHKYLDAPYVPDSQRGGKPGSGAKVAPRSPNAIPIALEDDLTKVRLRRRWKYIVVHHSGTDKGSAGSFNNAHKQRGWLGVGYHFVIGNGTLSKEGEIETTFRWNEQIQGAHAGVEEYNEHGIGICLVGDFNAGVPSPAQIKSLIGLTNYLQRRCGIPITQVLGHRDVKQTDCPGQLFPWAEFKRALQQENAWRSS